MRAFQGFANGFNACSDDDGIFVGTGKNEWGRLWESFRWGLYWVTPLGPLTGGLTELAVGMRPVFAVARDYLIHRYGSYRYLCERTAG